MAEGLANLDRRLLPGRARLGLADQVADQLPVRCGDHGSPVVSAATVVAIALLLFAPLLHYVPRAALAGLLLVTAARLIDFKRLSYAIKASRYDAGLVIVTAFTGIARRPRQAVLLGVVLSILLFVPRAAKLKSKELVVTPERVVRERIPSDAADPSISSTISKASCSSGQHRNSTDT